MCPKNPTLDGSSTADDTGIQEEKTILREQSEPVAFTVAIFK
jgi:hypothetical protein